MVAIQQIKTDSFYLASGLNERQTECRHRSPLDRLRPTARAGRALQLSLHAPNPGALPFRLPRTTGATPVPAEPLRVLRGPPQRGTARASKRPLARLRRAWGYRVACYPLARYTRAS